MPKDPWGGARDENGELFKFDKVGVVLEAIVVSREEKPSKYQKGETVGFYSTQSSEGKANFFSTQALDDALKTCVGRIVRIELVETKPSDKGNDIKVFEVKSLDNTAENRKLVGLDAFTGGASKDDDDAI
jgi:hypothetical protein